MDQAKKAPTSKWDYDGEAALSVHRVRPGTRGRYVLVERDRWVLCRSKTGSATGLWWNVVRLLRLRFRRVDAPAAGSTASSAERHQKRLGAASVRVDLADVIGQLQGSPPSEQIEAWLARLSDEEVFDWMSQLQPTETQDPDVMVRNAEVLQRLRDEALAHSEAGPRER